MTQDGSVRALLILCAHCVWRDRIDYAPRCVARVTAAATRTTLAAGIFFGRGQCAKIVVLLRGQNLTRAKTSARLVFLFYFIFFVIFSQKEITIFIHFRYLSIRAAAATLPLPRKHPDVFIRAARCCPATQSRKTDTVVIIAAEHRRPLYFLVPGKNQRTYRRGIRI